jgi:hypothetical protein
MPKRLVGLSLPMAVMAASLATLVVVPPGDARATSSLAACKLLSAKQVAAVHVGTSCTQAVGKANPYYTGVSATWGKLGGHGSVIVAVNHVSNHSYIGIWEAQHASGTSFGVGSWSRGSCVPSGKYCLIDFVVGDNVILLQVAPPTGQPLGSPTPVRAMAKTIASKLS